MQRTVRLLLALAVSVGGALPLAPSVARGAALEPVEPRSASSSAITEPVRHDPPISISFVGPRRFAGVRFDVAGTPTIKKWYGTIVTVERKADRTQLVDGVPYARVAEGALAGLWVKTNAAMTKAKGWRPRPPACRYDDILTSRPWYPKHAITLLDTIYRLNSAYAPSDLADTGNYAINGGYRVRAIIGKDLAAMAKAARAAGAPLQIVSAYRSYAQQKATFDYWVSVGGYEQALLTSARAGHSEHQLGTTIDFTSKGGAAPWNYADWATTAAGAWMKKHAWKYGFVMTYPKGETASTCYSYESWHYRYVGVGIATVLRETGMTLREAIWAAYGP